MKKNLFFSLFFLCIVSQYSRAQGVSKETVLSNIRSRLVSFTGAVSLNDADFTILSEDEKGLRLTGTLSVFSLSNVKADISATSNSATFTAGFSNGVTSQLTVDGKKLSSWLPSWLNGKMDLLKLSLSYQDAGASEAKMMVELGPPAAATPIIFQGMQLSQPSFTLILDKTGTNTITQANFSSALKFGLLNLSLSGTAASDAKWSFTANIGSLSLKDMLSSMASAVSVSVPVLPAPFENFTLNKAFLSFNSDNQINLAGAWNMGSMEAFFDQPKGQMVLALSPDNSFSFAKVSEILAPMDQIGFKDMAIIVANKEIVVKKMTGVLHKLNLDGSNIPAGVQVMGEFRVPSDLPGFRAKTTLTLSGLFPVPLALPTVKAATTFKNMEFGKRFNLLESFLQLNPADMKFGAGLRFSYKPDNQKSLDFTGMGEVSPPATFNLITYMNKGSFWNEPFGIKGLRIGELGLDIGADVLSPVPRPVIGIAGTIKIGSFSGTGSGSLNTANPLESAVSLSVNEISFQQVVNELMSDAVKAEINKLPVGARDFKITNAVLSLVPKTTTIAGKTLDQGFQLSGTGYISGFRARLNMGGSNSNGLFGEAVAAPVIVKNGSTEIFKLTGANGKDSSRIMVDLTKTTLAGGKPFMFFDATASLLGMTAGVNVKISGTGFKFTTTGKLFNKFSADLDGSGSGSIDHSPGMEIRAAMKSDLFEILNTEILSFINKETKTDQDRYKKAKDDLKESRDYLARTKADVEAFENEKERVEKQRKKVRRLKNEAEDINLNNEPWRGPEKAALWAAYETANGILKGYVKTLEKLSEAINWTKQNAYKDLVNSSLSVINGFEMFTTGTKAAARWVVDKGLESMVDIKSAEFNGKLNVVSGGSVFMKTNVVYMDKAYNLSYEFEFNDPAEAAERIARKLLDNLASSGSSPEFGKELF